MGIQAKISVTAEVSYFTRERRAILRDIR